MPNPYQPDAYTGSVTPTWEEWGNANGGQSVENFQRYNQMFPGQAGEGGIQQQQLRLQQDRQAYELQKKRDEDLRTQGLNPDGSPIATSWNPLTDSTGQLQDLYRLNIKGLDPTQMEGYSKYKQEALRTGPSAWANMQTQQQNNQAQIDKASAAQQAMSGNSQAMSGLAMRGGLSGGARTSLARSSQRDLLGARQKIAQQQGINRLALQSTDEQNRIQQLGQLAGTEQQMGQYNKTLEATQADKNIQNLLGEVQGKRAFEQNKYNEQMRAWAANKQADATAHSGGGGGK